MFAKISTALLVILVLAMAVPSVPAQEMGALLDILVRKKILTDQEAEEVRAELNAEAAQSPAGKLKLSTPVTELEIYGDARVRYEIRSGETGPPSTAAINDTIQRNRHRYRLRIGLRGRLIDDWFFGLRLETSASARSTNVTFGDDSGGPFAKGSDVLHVGQAYMGYRGFPDITLTAGRMANPFVTTPMVWDGDFNPEGLAEQWKRTFNFTYGGGGGGETATASYGKDGKGAVETAAYTAPKTMSIEVFANFGQFLYDDLNPENPAGDPPLANGRAVPEMDAYLIGYQVGAKFNFTKELSFQLAPTIYHYTGYGNDFNTFFVGGPTGNQTGVNSLFVFNVPWEFTWIVKELPIRFFGDFAVNLDAEDRAAAAGSPEFDGERFAYQVGVGVGRIRAKNDWQINLLWQHVEQFSVDPNLVDSDFFDSRVNMEGVILQAGYALSDAVTFNIQYGYGWQIEDGLGTGGSGDIAFNPLDKYQVFQADLNVKF